MCVLSTHCVDRTKVGDKRIRSSNRLFLHAKGFLSPIYTINCFDEMNVNMYLHVYHFSTMRWQMEWLSPGYPSSWWRHQMETFSALLALCAGNSPVPGEFPAQRPVTRSFDVFFYLCPTKRLSKQSWGWWFETLSSPLWRHFNVMENTDQFISHDQYPGCWRLGDASSQAINRHDIEIVLPVHPGLIAKSITSFSCILIASIYFTFCNIILVCLRSFR